MPWLPRLPLTWSLIALLALLVVVSQLGAYKMTADLLHETVRQRELDKAKAVSHATESLLKDDAHFVSQMAKLLQSYGQLSSAVLASKVDGGRALTQIMDTIFADLQLDVLEVTDAQAIVLYRAQDPARRGDRAQTWGMEEALAGREGMLTSSTDSHGVTIRATEPVRESGTIIGTVTAGMLLNEAFVARLSAEAGATLALISRRGLVASSHPELHRHLATTAMPEELQKNIPLYRQDPTAGVTSVYLPVLIIDEAFMILIQIDSTAAYRLLDLNMARSVQMMLLILLVSITAGVLLLRRILHPLRALRQRAEKTAVECTGAEISVSPGGEIDSVVRVLYFTRL